MTKEKITNILKKAVYSIAMAVLIFLLFVTSCITIGATIKAVDIAYDNGGRFADYIDRIADTLNDNNYSKATKGIVANAAVEVPYPDPEAYMAGYIPSLEQYDLLSSTSFAFGGTVTDYSLELSTIYTDGLSPLEGDVLLVSLPFMASTPDASFFPLTYHYNNGYDPTFGTAFIARRFTDNGYDPGGTLTDTSVNLIRISALYDSSNHYNGVRFRNYYTGTYQNSSITIQLFLLRPKVTSGSTTESLTDILGNSINFSTSAITTSVKEVFEGLFVNENNTISNYATYVVWFSGIAIALGFFKYILRFILTMGDKK